MGELQSLTEKQGKFVLMFTSDPACIGRPKEAALAAGFSPETAHVQCYQLLSKPHVKAAITKAMQEQISGPLAAQALAVLGEIMNDPAASKGVRVDAAKAVLDRAGFVSARTPVGLSDLSQKDLKDMSSGELADVMRQANEARARIEQQLKDVTPGSAQIEGQAVRIDGDSAGG